MNVKKTILAAALMAALFAGQASAYDADLKHDLEMFWNTTDNRLFQLENYFSNVNGRTVEIQNQVQSLENHVKAEKIWVFASFLFMVLYLEFRLRRLKE